MKTTITKVTAVLLAIFLSSVVAFSQTIVTTVPSIAKCSGQTGLVSFDIKVQNFTYIGSLSLKLKFNPANMLYTGYTVNPLISSGFILNGQNTGANAGTVKLAWYTLDSVSIPNNATMITLKFNYLGGNASLAFDTAVDGDCMYSDWTGSFVLPAQWINGGISVTSAPVLTTNPANLAIASGANAVFNVATSATASYQWQTGTSATGPWTTLIDNATFSGSTTNQLTITSAGTGLSGSFYMCSVTESVCNLSTNSTAASLMVTAACTDPLVFNTSGGGTYCPAGAGLSVDLSNSEVGVNYELFHNGSGSGTIIAGTGSPISFTGISTVGSYTIKATSSLGTCNSMQNGLATVLAATALGMTQNPLNSTITSGHNAFFTVTGNYPESALSFQWQISTDGGLNFTNLSNGTSYAGVSSSALSVWNAPVSLNNAHFRCILHEAGCNQTLNSSAGTLTVNVPPTINTYLPVLSGLVSGNTVSVPVTYDHMLNVSAMSLSFLFNNSVLTYQGISGVNSALSPDSYVVNDVSGNLKFSWFSVTPISLTDGTLFNINFTFNGGTASLTWDESQAGDCQYTDGNLNILPAVFHNGSVEGCTLPTAFAVGGGGINCPGDDGQNISLSGSQIGVTYELYHDGSASGFTEAGTGSAIQFVNFTAGTYSILASEGLCSTLQSGNAIITESPVLLFTTQPADANIAEGGNASYSVDLTSISNEITYQWKVSTDGGNIYTNLTNGGNYSGVSNSTLSITNIPYAFNDYRFVCVVNEQGGCNQSLTSLFAALSVTQTSTINTYLPHLTALVPGSTVSIPVTADNLNNVGAISLTFLYDNTVLSYQGTTNLLPALAAGSPLFNNTTGKIKFSWYGLDLVSLSSGTLFTVDFVYNGGTSSLNWNTSVGGDCEYADTDGNNLLADYHNGSVSGCALPIVFTASGGGVYCAAGVPVGVDLSSSEAGVTYTLFVDGITTDITIPGTGSGISFTGITSLGTYSVQAKADNGDCFTWQSGSVTVSAPLALSVTLDPSSVNIPSGDNATFLVSTNYAAASVTYYWEVSTNGGLTYTIMSDDANYSGVNTATLNILNAPYSFNGNKYRCFVSETACGLVVTSAGATLTVTQALPINTYLPTITGVTQGTTISIPVTAENISNVGAVSLSFIYDPSVLTYVGYSGLNADLALGIFSLNDISGKIKFGWFNTTPLNISSGTLFNIDFTYNGGTSLLTWNVAQPGECQYADFDGNTVNANYFDGSVTGCSLPAVYNVSGGGVHCAGAVGNVVYIDQTELSTTYSVLLNGVATGVSFAGNGSSQSQTFDGAGVYTISATNSCGSKLMAGSATISIQPLPLTFNVSGGGTFCSGGDGINVGLDGSEAGLVYTLKHNNLNTLNTVTGNGSALNFGLQTVAGTYTVTVSSPCGIFDMTGSAVINLFPTPSLFTVTGGGAYCTGSAAPSVSLSGSEVGVTYTLYHNGISTAVTKAGTGSSVSFGSQTVAGTYTIVASNTCGTLNMTGSVSVTLSPGPISFIVNGGGAYCTGGIGVAIGLTGSESAVVYTLIYNGTPTSATVTGTGASISFGIHSAIGTYTVSGHNSCGTTAMAGSASVSINALPLVYTMTGGGNYIGGGSGVSVGLSGSQTGVNYLLYVDGLFTGQTVAGTGSTISFGNQTIAGNYTASATNISTTCNSTMTGSALVSVTPIIVTNPADTAIFTGYSASFTVVSVGGTTYQWQVSFDGGLTWTNLTNNAPYYNVNTPNLDIIGALIGMNTFMYQCVVSSGTASVTSLPATLNVIPAPVLTTIAPTMTATAGTLISVPIDVLNFGGISAFNLTLNYTPSVMTYSGVANMNPGLSTGDPSLFIFENGTTPGEWFMAYNSMIPATIGNGKLLDLKFNYIGGYTPLVWKLVPHENAEYADPLGNVLPSIWINGSINSIGGTAITVQPDDATGCEGGSTSYSITAPGATNYQWIMSPDFGMNWFDLTNSALYTGVNTNTLIVNGISSTMVDFLFACKVDVGMATAAGSDPASLSITPFVTVPGTIVAAPGTTICPGNNVTFSVSAAYSLTGATYQWFVNSIPVATTATFSTTALMNGDVVKADVYVAGSCAFLNIPTLTMVVDPHPVVTTAPENATAVVGDAPGFSVVATAPGNSPLSYQWQISTNNGTTWTNLANGPDYTGVTTANMHITYATMPMNGNLFHCVVTEGTCGNTVTSDYGKLFMFYGPIITKLADQVVCGNSQMVVPVKVDNFIDVASISLKMNYDANFLTYTGFQNVNPALVADPFSLFTISATATQVSFFGFSLTPVSLTNNATMVELLFTPVPGTSSLTWESNTFGSCMYTDINGTVIPDEYINATYTINPLPAIFQVTGGGNYCVGGSGQPVGLSGSAVGFTYELYNNNFSTFLTLAGTGGPLTFGNQFAAGVYTITATNNSSGCSQIMGGSAVIIINPLPVVTFNGTLASQCLGVTSYVLTGGTPSGGTYSGPGVTNNLFYPTVAGIGTHTITYSYQDPINGCINSATKTITVIHGPLPNTVTGGGAFCQGGIGVTVGLNGSEIGMLYQTQINGIVNGPPVGGTGLAITFGLQTIPGVYTILGTDPNTLCTLVMPNSVTVEYAPLPNAFTVTGGGAYCVDGNGVAVGLSGSAVGTNYQLEYNGFAIGTPVAGTGSAISFGLHLMSGFYTVVATNSFGCINTMTGNVTITINQPPTVSFASYLQAQCITNTTYAIIGGFPLGGTYSGNGITGNNFNASVAGLGAHLITYTYTSPATGCTNTATNWIAVNANPTVTWNTSLAHVCPDNTNYLLSGGLPAGGVYSGPGVVGNVFNASLLGAGSYTLSYTFTDQATGCFATATQTMVVDPLPIVTWNGSLTALCEDAAAVTLIGGIPAGGTYSGPGVAGNTFNPALVGPGTYTLKYTYTNPATSCTNFVTNIMVVNPLPVVAFSGKLETQCSNSTAMLMLTGFPAGGTYSGSGVTGNIFNASVAGLGTFVITYTYTNPATGCTNYATNDVTVVPGPSVSWTAPLIPQCANATNYVLPAGSPAGGVFSGPGVTGNVFNASSVVPGTYTLTYSVTFTANGCTASTSNTIVVNPLPALSWSNVLTNQCITSASYTLTGATPAGGTYSGIGVTGNNFNASVAGLGLHVITYTYTNSNGCTNSITNTITVNPLPVVTLGPITAVCLNASAFALSTGTPAGGTYSGTGVSGGNFNPSLSGVGSFTITYTYTNANGCTSSASAPITVYSLPVVTLGSVPSVCVNAPTFVLNTGSPVGGTYSGVGISGGIYNPAVAGVGSHVITYTVTNSNNCTVSATTTIIVNALPVVSWSNTLTQQCVTSSTYALTGGTPAGGTYSGPGVNGTNFNAALVGALLGTGTYTLTYTFTNSNGCTASASNSIVVNPLPVVSWTGTLADQCTYANAYTLTGGIPAGGTYSGPGVTGSNFNASLAGVGVHTLTYTYTNPATGCTSATTKPITVMNPVAVYWNNVLPSPCQNITSVTLSGATPAGGTYSGPGVNAGVFDPSLIGPGSYTLTYTYTDPQGCTGTASNSITVNALPSMSWSNALTTQCVSANFYLLSGASPAGGVYSGPGVFGNNFNAANVGVGTYTLTYTYTSSAGCTNNVTNTITVVALPTVTLGPNQNICFGTTTTLTATASAGVNYTWSTGASTPSISIVVGDTNTYAVTVTNSFGCKAIDSVIVNMLPLPNAQASALPKTICKGESATLSATGGSGATPYVWGTGQTSSSFVSNNNQDTTVFFVTVTNSYGCHSVANVKLNVNKIPIVALNGGVAQLTACNYTNALLVPGPGPYDTYLWNTGDQTATLSIETDLIGASTFTTYTVTVTLNGCQAMDNIILYVDPCGGIQEIGTQQLIEVYPNPTDGQFTLNLENVGEGTILDIYNNLGQNMLREKLANAAHAKFTKTFDLSSYPMGIYYLRFTDGDKVYSKKLIVK